MVGAMVYPTVLHIFLLIDLNNIYGSPQPNAIEQEKVYAQQNMALNSGTYGLEPMGPL